MKSLVLAFSLALPVASAVAMEAKVVWQDPTCAYFVVQEVDGKRYRMHRLVGGEPVRLGDTVQGEAKALGEVQLVKVGQPVPSKTYFVSHSEDLKMLVRYAPFECHSKWTAKK